MNQKTKDIITIIFHGIWLVAAGIFWIGGLIIFLANKDAETWFLWGIRCAVLVIIPLIRALIDTVKKGAREGANEYTATIDGDTIHVRNHPIRGAVWALFGGILGAFLISPIIVPLYGLLSIFKVIFAIISLSRGD